MFWAGWLYLTVVLDLYDRKAIDWAFSAGLETVQTTIPALRMAFWPPAVPRFARA
jgi:transposase InsO family protein